VLCGFWLPNRALVADICRKARISQATYFNWKREYDGLLPTEMHRLKQLENENAKLRKVVAYVDKEMLGVLEPPDDRGREPASILADVGAWNSSKSPVEMPFRVEISTSRLFDRRG
jgi:Transposase